MSCIYTTWLSNVFCSYCSIFLQCNIKFKLVCWWLVLRLRAENQRALLNGCTPFCFHLSMYVCTTEGLARNTCNIPQWLISDACNSVSPRVLLGSGVEEGCLIFVLFQAQAGSSRVGFPQHFCHIPSGRQPNFCLVFLLILVGEIHFRHNIPDSGLFSHLHCEQRSFFHNLPLCSGSVRIGYPSLWCLMQLRDSSFPLWRHDPLSYPCSTEFHWGLSLVSSSFLNFLKSIQWRSEEKRLWMGADSLYI